MTVAPARSRASSAARPSHPWVTFPLDSIWSRTSSAIRIGTARPVVLTPGGLVRIPTSSPFVLNSPPPEVSGVVLSSAPSNPATTEPVDVVTSTLSREMMSIALYGALPFVDATATTGWPTSAALLASGWNERSASGTSSSDQVGVGVAAHDLGRVLAAEAGVDHDRGRTGHDVGAREHPVAAHRDPGGDGGAGRAGGADGDHRGHDELAHPGRHPDVDGGVGAREDRRRERRSGPFPERPEGDEHQQRGRDPHRRPRRRRSPSRVGAPATGAGDWRRTSAARSGGPRAGRADPGAVRWTDPRPPARRRHPPNPTPRGVYRRPSPASRRPSRTPSRGGTPGQMHGRLTGRDRCSLR